jgi:hypothetical protein
VVEAARGNTTQFTLETEWSRPSDVGPLSHRVTVDTSADATLEAERVMRSDGKSAFDTHAPAPKGAKGKLQGGAINVALRSLGKGNSEGRAYAASKSLLVQVEAGGRADPDAIKEVRLVQHALRSIVFLEIQPSRMRDYRPEHAHVLGTSGENVSPKLRALPAERLADIVDWLSELCAPTLDGISFDVTKLKEVMFFLDEGNTKVSARSVSDGTLRFLGLVTALLTAEKGSLIVLEEPDVGLHPARIHLLARLMEQVTQGRDVQVVATTHSPTLLAHLSAESLANVVALGRNDEGCTVCERIGNLEHFSTLRDSKQLDHLVSTGWIERAM